MKITNDQLSGVTLDVCQTMLGTKIAECNVDDLKSTPDRSASIQISGEHNAVIEVSVCQLAGQSLTSAMFAGDSETFDTEEIADAVSEVANIIGGNVKGILDGESKLSIPCFSNRATEEIGSDSQMISFDLNGGVMNVSFRTVKQAGE